MSKTVIYWSGTGNTEAIANKIAQDLGVNALTLSQTSVDEVAACDVIVFGCPAMGAEELEDSEVRPFFDELKDKLSGKTIALFGSYGWGDGEWLRLWKDECEQAGANVAGLLMAMGDDSALDDSEYNTFIASIA